MHGTTEPLDLPVYYHWEFSTGAEGDFEELVRRLERRHLDEIRPMIGARSLFVGDAGAGLPNINTLDLGGALSVGNTPPQSVNGDFQIALNKILNGDSPSSQALAVLPPIYGQWHAAQRILLVFDTTVATIKQTINALLGDTSFAFGKLRAQLLSEMRTLEDQLALPLLARTFQSLYAAIQALKPPLDIDPRWFDFNIQWTKLLEQIKAGSPRDARWLRDLNLDPRHRVAAALGGQVVRQHQEELMTAAWSQTGVIQEANQMLRQAQLAREASRRLHEDFLSKMNPVNSVTGKTNSATVIIVTAPVHAQVAANGVGGDTVYKTVGESRVPAPIVSAAFRRFARSRGPLARRMGVDKAQDWAARILGSINDGSLQVVQPPAQQPGGMTTIDPDKVFGDPKKMCHRDWETILGAYSQTIEEALQRIDKAIESLMLKTELAENASIDLKDILPSTTLPDIQAVCAKLKRLKSDIDNTDPTLKDPKPFVERANQIIFNVNSIVTALDTIAKSDPDKAKRISNLIQRMQEIRQELGDLIATLRTPWIQHAFIELQKTVEKCDYQPAVGLPLDTNALSGAILTQLVPATTIERRMAMLIEAPGWPPPGDALEPVLIAPEFPEPMYKHLVDLSLDWLLPGLDRVPPNTIGLTLANEPFIEAFMVGLSHELGRELLWRGYPTDQRGTNFKQFWDPRGRVPAPPTPQAGYDIQEPISEWYYRDPDPTKTRDASLGEHLATASQAPLVLLIRGELLQRYPRAIIYFAAAYWTQVNGKDKRAVDPDVAKEFFPDFMAKLDPDTTFLGFVTLDADKARGDSDPNNGKPGYFVVIQQQPTEPRYGLDLTPPDDAEKTGTWRDLAWPNVLSPDRITSGAYVHLSDPLIDFAPPAPLTWGPSSTSPQLAAITRQQPFRIAIHASDLLPIKP